MRRILKSFSNSTLYLAITDYFILVGSFAVVMRLRFRPDIDIIDIATLHLIPQVAFIFLYVPVVLCLFSALGLYRRKMWLLPAGHLIAIGKGVILAIFGYIFLQYLTKSSILLEYRSVIFAWGVAAFSLLVINRLVVLDLLTRWISQSDLRRRVIVIGASEVGRTFAERCVTGREYATLKVIGFLDEKIPAGEVVSGDFKCLGAPEDIADIVDLYNLEGAVITESDLTYQRLMDLTETCVRLFGWVDIHCDKSSCLYESLDVDTYFEIPFVRMRNVPDTTAMRLCKRTADILMAAFGIILLSPVFLATALAVKLTSPGPVLYVTDRIGYKGRKIKFYKFRSMRLGADRDEKRAATIREYVTNEDSGLPNKIVNEDFVTPAGRFIRKWGIDELPQLFSVLKGDMSVVGPRPSPVDEYMVNDEWQKKRFDIKPGCTGLWKIYSTRHKDGTFSKSVMHDIYYARNMSPLLDVYIIFKTVEIILRGRADT